MTAGWSRQVEDLFHAALEHVPAERSAFLEEACAAAPELRADVDSLLRANDNAGSFIETPATDTVADSGPRVDEAWIGRRIGNCLLSRILGSGGMGTVFEAEQETPRRIVALKLMRAGISSPEALQRFHYEVEVLGRLQHPGIARMYEAGMHDAGVPVPYFVMEYVQDAAAIDDFADSRGLAVRERLKLVTRVCDAVHHGHLRGVVHRDLKPANILVDVAGAPRVIDFGIARVTESDRAQTMATLGMQTGPGQLLGTLAYMSPEQCDEDPSGLDPRSDVYALGVVLYELLCGEMPYDVRAVGLVDAIRTITESAPRRPSTHVAELRGDVETIVLRALEKDRERRYGSAGELADDIRRYLDHEPIRAHPPSTFYQLRMFARRNRLPVLAIAAVLVVLAGATVVSAWFAVAADRERTKALEVSGFLKQMILSIDPELAQGRDVTLLRAMLDDAAQRVDQEFADFDDLRADLSDVIGRTYLRIYRLDEADRFLGAARKLQRGRLGDEHPDTLSTALQIAVLRTQQGREADAEKIARAILAAQLDSQGDEDPRTLETRQILAMTLSRQGRYDEAQRELEGLLPVMRRVLGEDDPLTLSAEGDFAQLVHEQRRLPDAEKLYVRLLDRLRAQLGPEHPKTLVTEANLVNLYAEMGRIAKVEPLVRRHGEACLRVFGAEHAVTLAARERLASVLCYQDRSDEAAALYTEILGLYRALRGDEHFSTLSCEYSLSNVLVDQKKFAEAEPLARHALSGWCTQMPDDAYTVGVYSVNHGRILVELRRFAEARPVLEEGKRLVTEAAGPTDSWARRASELLSALQR